MKKVLLFCVVALAFASCGGKKTEEAPVVDTAIVADTTVVADTAVVADSTATDSAVVAQ